MSLNDNTGPVDKLVVTVGEGLVRCLAREGVDVAFGIPSGYLAGFLHAMRLAGMRSITNLHEGAAGCAAAGYAMASGKLGVVYAQSGPGVTNALTGIASAYMDSLPVLLLAAQTPVSVYGRDAHQEATGAVYGIDQMDVYRSATSAIYRPPTADTAIRTFRRALAVALCQRTTAAIEVATDVMTSKVEFDDLAPAAYRTRSAVRDVAGIERLADLLRDAKRPVLLVGHRALHRGLSADIVALCEEQDIPCATVDFAKGAIAEDHPLAVGVLGTCGHESAAACFRDADLVITLGARMGTLATLNFDASLFSRLVQIDEHVDEVGRNFPLALGIVCDIGEAVRGLRAALGSKRQTRGAADRVRRLREEHAVYEQRPADRAPTSTPLALAALREVLPRDTLVVGDSGLTLQYLKQFFPVYAPDGFYCLYSLAAMGAGLPLSIGVQLARPDAVVLCVVGDGGALVHLSELAVAAQHKLPIIFVVMNNHGYKQVSDRMERYQAGAYGCEVPNVDFAAVAAGCGVDGYRAHDHASVAAAARTALERRRPALIEVAVQGDNLFDITPKQFLEYYDRMYGKNPAPSVWPFPKSKS
jgi:acetolactate synthase I/II/III large subunit